MSSFFYGVLWILCNVLSRLFLRFRVVGKENLPKAGGVLLAANHASYLDIPLLGCGAWRRLYYIGRSNLFPNRLLSWWLRCLGWIPLKADRVDRQALGMVVDLLQAGEAVVIFPEGTRTDDGHLKPGKPGIGMLVEKSPCPVVPVYLDGPFQVWPMGPFRIRLHPVTVIFGKPIDFSEDIRRFQSKELYYHISKTVMARIAEIGHVEPPADCFKLTQAVPPSTCT